MGGPAAGTGNRHDTVRAQNIVEIARSQVRRNRLLVLEANKRSLVWSLMFVQDLLRDLTVTEHSWCWHEARLGVIGRKCNTVYRIASNFNLGGPYSCTCADAAQHVNAKQLSSNEREVRSKRVLESIVSVAFQSYKCQSSGSPVLMTRSHRQPESDNPTSASLQHPFPNPSGLGGLEPHSPNGLMQPPVTDVSASASCPGRSSTGQKAISFPSIDPAAHTARKSDLLQALDDHSAHALSVRDFSFKTCVALLRMFPFKSSPGRQSLLEGQSQTLGLYRHGAGYGITSLTFELPHICMYLNAFVSSHRASGTWTSLTLNRNAQLDIHWDHGNLRGSMNQLIGLGSYRGGDLWIQLFDHEVSDARNVQWMTSNRQEAMPGITRSCKHRMLRFEPERMHATMPWEGERFTIAIYTNKAIVEVDQSILGSLIDLGFPVDSRVNLSPSHAHSAAVELGASLPSQPAFAYPTDQALRQKERLKKAKLAGESPKKRMQVVEQVQQDCGEDLGSIIPVTDCHVWTPALMGSCDESSLSLEQHAWFEHVFSVIGGNSMPIHGSACCEPDLRFCPNGVCSLSQLWQMSNRQLRKSKVYLVEFFGGKSMMSYMSVRGHDPVSHQNFDVVAAYSLHDPADVDLLVKYVADKKPYVVIMCPPCVPSLCNRASNPKSKFKTPALSHPEGTHVADVCLHVVRVQRQGNRHFLLEQPFGSNLFQMPAWSEIGTKVRKCVFDQCQLGLLSTHLPKLAVRKRTEIWATHDFLVCNLRFKQCSDEHAHAPEASNTSNFAYSNFRQTWPLALSQCLAAAVSDVIGHADLSFPTTDTRLMICPGCRWHKRKDHESHTRRDDCMHKDVKTKVWSCPGCIANKPRVHEDHVLDDTCQWAVARDMPSGASRERSGGDVRIPASREPTAQARISTQSDEPSRAKRRDYTPAAKHRDAAVQVVNGGLGDGGVAAAPRPTYDAATGAGSSGDAAPVAAGDSTRDRRSSGDGVASRLEPAEPPTREGIGDAGSAVAREDASEPSDWTRFDLGKALQRLRSLNEGVVRRALRQLHVRFYHPSAQRFRSLLAAAGVEPRIFDLVGQITDTCAICRAWTRPGPKAVMSTNLPTSFNEEVQVDLLFMYDKVVLHMIDVCTRFCVAVVVADRESNTLLTALQRGWLSVFGPPSAIVADQEGGLASPAATAWMAHRDIQFRPKARYAHAQMVERHHALLRHQVHLLKDQTMEEGLRASFESLLSESVYVKNALMRVGSATPYEAVLGRVPRLFDVVGTEAGPDIQDRDADRLRSKAISAMIQATASSKLERASKHKSRVTGELLELSPGEQVDYWRQPATKDHSGWLGPASVVDVSTIPQGHVSIRFQGRVMLCRVQDIRRSLMYPALMSQEPLNTPVGVIRHAAESLNRQVVRLGWFKQLGTWRDFECNAKYSVEVIAGLHMAACNLQFNGVISFRLGNSVPTLPAVACDESLLLLWDIGHLDSWSVAYLPGYSVVNFERIFQRSCNGLAFVQFFSEDSETVLSLREHVHDVPNLGGINDPQLPNLRDVTADVERRRMQHALENGSAEDQTGPQTFDIGTPEDERSVVDAPSEMPVDTEEPEFFLQSEPPTVQVDSSQEQAFVFESGEDLKHEPLQLEFTAVSSKYLISCECQPTTDETVLINFDAPAEAVIERANNILTRDEALANVSKCKTAMVKELLRWNGHNAWKRYPRAQAKNALISKWVLKWKVINGSRDIKARLVVQGFRDLQTVQNFAGTTSRWGQRLVLITAVQFQWAVLSADVSEAFLRGLTFKELHECGYDSTLREVQLILPAGCDELIHAVPGLEDFDSQREVLYLLRPGFGLKDAPRLWALALKRVLSKLHLTPLNADTQLFAKHVKGRLVALLSVHVDDLKITGLESERKVLVQGLEKEFDALKLDLDNFEHLGLRHTLEPDGSRTVSQQHYVAELKPIPTGALKLMKPDDVVNPETAKLYMSLLGGVAWTTQTRLDVAVFVAALQRRLKEPRVQDVVNLNRVLKYLKVKPLCLRYKKVGRPWRLMVISDSSFKGEGQEHLAMRSGILALADRDGPRVGDNTLQLLEFACKKQCRVCRSTFAAELLSALDIAGLALRINSAMTEVLEGCTKATTLLAKQECMTHALEINLIIDAYSVWASATAEEVKCTDANLVLHLLAFRELLGRGIKRLLWTDTRDMLADGLNKGIVNRQPIRDFCEKAVWCIQHEMKIHSFAPVQTSDPQQQS